MTRAVQPSQRHARADDNDGQPTDRTLMPTRQYAKASESDRRELQRGNSIMAL